MAVYTRHTPLTDEQVLDVLPLVRDMGFALSEQEFEEGINAVAAPILDASDRPLAAIAVVGPAYRLTRSRMIEIGPSVAATAGEIAHELAVTPRFQALGA